MRPRFGLGVISFRQNAGGVAYVARLLSRALHDLGPAPWTVSLDTQRRDPPRLRARASFAVRLAAAQATRRVDVMLFNHVGVARAQHALPSFLRVPHAVFTHDIEAWSTDIPPAHRAALLGASLVVANSGFTARRVERAHPGLKVEPCPLGLMEESASADEDVEFLRSVGAHAALIVGRVTSDERYKGHDQLIEAWPLVTQSVPDARLFVAGWGDDVPRLQAKAAALGVADAVVFCGYLSEGTLGALFRRVAVYTMPSAREGFGLVYLEAMRAGTPCIGSTLDAASEVIVHGETGFVVDRDRPGELAAALTTLLVDTARRDAMGHAGRKHFEREFTYESFRSRLHDILSRRFGM